MTIQPLESIEDGFGISAETKVHIATGKTGKVVRDGQSAFAIELLDETIIEGKADDFRNTTDKEHSAYLHGPVQLPTPR